MGERNAQPFSDIDLFSDVVLQNPYPHFKKLRDMGPAVFLERLGAWFLGRYDVVRNALVDWETFSSARGVGITDEFNTANARALICQDPPEHNSQRALFLDKLSPHAIRPVSDTIDMRARSLIKQLRERGLFDAVSDLAHDLPVNVIMDLVGWQPEIRERLIPMAIAWFNTVGPMNLHCQKSWPVVKEMAELVAYHAQAGDLREGSFGHHLLVAHRAGAITFDALVGLLMGYVVAAFDTTINAISSAMVLLARNSAQWQMLREQPNLSANAFSEVLRLESPVQYFTRVTTREVVMEGGCIMPANSRVLICYGSANRDERHFEQPDIFDVNRKKSDHLAFGAGRHACAGQFLARLEGKAVLQALASEVTRIELVGDPVIALNNGGRGYERVPTILH